MLRAVPGGLGPQRVVFVSMFVLYVAMSVIVGVAAILLLAVACPGRGLQAPYLLPRGNRLLYDAVGFLARVDVDHVGRQSDARPDEPATTPV